MCLHDSAQEVEQSPFHRKRSGDFAGALKGYARRLAEAQDSGNLFISEKCFEQVFDIYLLQYLKEAKHFATKQQLKDQLQSDIRLLLAAEECSTEKASSQWFDDCWRQLFPRGPRPTPFSVYPNVLIQ